MKFKWERNRTHEGMMIPSKLLGFAYNDFDRDVRVFYIFPINLLVAAFRWLDIRVRYMIPIRMQMLERELFDKGYHNGYLDGNRAGYEQGLREGRRLENEEILARFDAKIEKLSK